VLPDTVIEDYTQPLNINIGGKTITLRDRCVHTPSDLNIEIASGGKDGQKIVYTGETIFNKIFPVYLDALPQALRSNVAEVISEDGGKNIIIPGHRAPTTGADLRPFLALIDHIAEASRKAHTTGTPAKADAEAFTVPPELKDYTPSNPLIGQLTMDAMHRQLDGMK